MNRTKITVKRAPRRRSSRHKNPFRRLPWKVLSVLFFVLLVCYIVFVYRNLVSPYSFRWKAIFGETTYPKGDVRGIDISHHQGEIDWERLANAQIQGSPLQFVFIKATEGTDLFDKDFNYNFAEARRHEVIRGAYHFFSLKSSARRQAEFFCHTVQLEPGDLPPVLDVETDPKDVKGYTRERLRREVLEWLAYVEHHYGVKPMIYASYSYKKENLGGEPFDCYPFWIAHYYVDSLSYKGQWTFWQHTDAGHVDGIRGDVDINLFNGTSRELHQLLIPEE